MTERNTLLSDKLISDMIYDSYVSQTTSLTKPQPQDTKIGSKQMDLFTTSGKISPLGSDPLGKGQHESGAKLDAGKNRLDLVLGDFAQALWEVGRVGTYGANKYTDRGWLSVPNGRQRYGDALLRHYLLDKRGEIADRESGIDHLAHAAWNALAVLQLALMERGNGKT